MFTSYVHMKNPQIHSQCDSWCNNQWCHSLPHCPIITTTMAVTSVHWAQQCGRHAHHHVWISTNVPLHRRGNIHHLLLIQEWFHCSAVFHWEYNASVLSWNLVSLWNIFITVYLRHFCTLLTCLDLRAVLFSLNCRKHATVYTKVKPELMVLTANIVICSNKYYTCYAVNECSLHLVVLILTHHKCSVCKWADVNGRYP